MNNISFANPWLLLIALPLLAVVITPFCITVRRDNANGHNIAAVCLHCLLCICFTLAVAGMSFETVITETNVYVLADISYSSENNLDEVQDNIEKISKKLPKNSKMGVICFGRNYQLLSDLGGKIPDITKADKVDRSATDIGSALRYAGNLFDDGVIKRIIIITDGAETVSSNNIVKVVNALQSNDVYVDAVYLDNNLADDVPEIQIDGVEVNASTFINKAEEVGVLVRANCVGGGRTDGYVSLYKDGVQTASEAVSLYSGLNAVTLPLSTEEAGSFSYEVRVETVAAENDSSPHNNAYIFTQKISDERKVLFIGGSAADVAAGRKIYGETDVTYLSGATGLPVSVEELCVYDEIALCNFDVRTVISANMFLTSLTTLVDDYGKTLTTFGNTFVQEDDGSDTAPNRLLRKLADLLPVKIGNNDQDTRLVAIVFDVSKSMNFNSRFEPAKRVATELLGSLNRNDMVLIVSYSDMAEELLPPGYLSSPNVIKRVIQESETELNTNLGNALEMTYGWMPKRYHDRQVIIISDGQTASAANAVNWAKRMASENIALSAIGIYAEPANDKSLEALINNSEVSSTADRIFYKNIVSEKEIDVTIQSITEEKEQIRIEGDAYAVTVRRSDESVTDGVGALPALNGFWYNSAKSTAKTVLSVKYFRDKITSFDIPVYAYWSGGGNGRVISFLSDISSGWTAGWGAGTDGERFLSNIPVAALPDERINTPFIVDVDSDGSSAAVYVRTSSGLQSSASFTVTLTNPDGIVTEKPLTYNSGSYFALFSTDKPGKYTVHLEYAVNDLRYETDSEFTVFYYAEYDSFASYSKSYMYRLLTPNGKILELDEIKRLENSDSSYTEYTFSFVMPLMIVCAVIFVVEIIIRQLRWKDVTSFFSGLFRGRRRV